MWYNEWNNTAKVIARIVWLKKDEPKHFFEIFKWFGDKKKVIMPEAMEIDGKLKAIEVGSYEYEGKTKDTMTFILDDWKEEIHRQTSFNKVSRNTIYALNSLKEIKDKMTLTLYMSQAGNKNLWLKHWKEDVKSILDREEDIKAKTWVVMDWEEFVKYNYKELDKRIKEELIPWINESIYKEPKSFADIETEDWFNEAFDEDIKEKTKNKPKKKEKVKLDDVTEF